MARLIIQNGCYQLLTVTGVAASSVTSTCILFLGSSFPCVSSFLKDPCCYVLCTPAETHQRYRYLRDYTKKDACLKIAL
jgi:hypothetical protein